jgi:hypothetical protein
MWLTSGGAARGGLSVWRTGDDGEQLWRFFLGVWSGMNATTGHDERPGGSAHGSAGGPKLESLASLGSERGWRDELLWQLTERIRTQRLQQQLRRARSEASG